MGGNLSSGCLTKQDSNMTPYLQRLASKILLVAILDMIISKKQITIGLIRLRVCTFVVRKPPKKGFLSSRPIGRIQYIILDTEIDGDNPIEDNYDQCTVKPD